MASDDLLNGLLAYTKQPFELQQLFADVSSPPPVLDDDISAWETAMTDPREHPSDSSLSPDHYRYLVHAVSLSHSSARLRTITVRTERTRDPSIPAVNINLLEHPDRIAQKPLISTSLIDEHHRATWTGGGYVLRVPQDNLLETHIGDGGTDFVVRGEEQLRKKYEARDQYGIFTPGALLALTLSTSYNEVVATGTGRTGKQVELTGVFAKVLPDGEFVEPELARRLRVIAHSRGLPFINLDEPYLVIPNGTPPNIFGEENKGFGFDHNGTRYIFCVDEQRFSVAEYGGKKIHPMSLRERDEALSHLRQYLVKNPDAELDALVTRAEVVPAETLASHAQNWLEFRRRDDTYDSFDVLKR